MRGNRGKDDSFILAWMESDLQVHPARASVTRVGVHGPSMLDSAVILR